MAAAWNHETIDWHLTCVWTGGVSDLAMPSTWNDTWRDACTSWARSPRDSKCPATQPERGKKSCTLILRCSPIIAEYPASLYCSNCANHMSNLSPCLTLSHWLTISHALYVCVSLSLSSFYDQCLIFYRCFHVYVLQVRLSSADALKRDSAITPKTTMLPWACIGQCLRTNIFLQVFMRACIPLWERSSLHAIAWRLCYLMCGCACPFVYAVFIPGCASDLLLFAQISCIFHEVTVISCVSWSFISWSFLGMRWGRKVQKAVAKCSIELHNSSYYDISSRFILLRCCFMIYPIEVLLHDLSFWGIALRFILLRYCFTQEIASRFILFFAGLEFPWNLVQAWSNFNTTARCKEKQDNTSLERHMLEWEMLGFWCMIFAGLEFLSSRMRSGLKAWKCYGKVKGRARPHKSEETCTSVGSAWLLIHYFVCRSWFFLRKRCLWIMRRSHALESLVRVIICYWSSASKVLMLSKIETRAMGKEIYQSWVKHNHESDFESYCRLQVLDLSDCEIRAEGMELLWPGVRASKTLHSLNLSGNKIGLKGYVAFFICSPELPEVLKFEVECVLSLHLKQPPVHLKMCLDPDLTLVIQKNAVRYARHNVCITHMMTDGSPVRPIMSRVGDSTMKGIHLYYSHGSQAENLSAPRPRGLGRVAERLSALRLGEWSWAAKFSYVCVWRHSLCDDCPQSRWTAKTLVINLVTPLQM